MLGFTNVYKSTYHSQTNGQIQRHNRTLAVMQQNYLNDHQEVLIEYASALSNAYDCQLHQSAGTKPPDLVQSRPPPDFMLHDEMIDRLRPDCVSRTHLLRRIEGAVQNKSDSFQRTQARYKKYIDRRVTKNNQRLRPSDCVYIDTSDGVWKPRKLDIQAIRPFRALTADERSVFVYHDAVVETISDQAMHAELPVQIDSREPDQLVV